MARLNVPQTIYTHEGGKAKGINPELQLKRSIMSCLLWESQFYEDGVQIADRIKELIPKVSECKVTSMTIEARNKMKLRHIPLLIAREMARLNLHKISVSYVLENIIQRPDELTEFLAIYWKDGREPLSAQVKKGLARAFTKFDAYQLAKYNRDTPVKLRDVLFLTHPKPKNKEQEETWKQLVDRTLPIPYTWETELSAGKNKKTAFEKLLKENRLGAMALLRNLRGMREAKVDENLIQTALGKMKVERILPFRFIAAARYAPEWEEMLERAMLKCLASHEKLQGKTVLLVDVSGSMGWKLSDRSQMNRMDAACGVAMLAREICDKVEVLTFSNNVARIAPRHGFALRDAIVGSQRHGGTYLGGAVKAIQDNGIEYNRIIVITDEQSHDNIPNPNAKGYVVNVASCKNGVGYGAWIHIDGWSEAVIDYIREFENWRSNY